MTHDQFKKNIRCIGFDDMPFTRKNNYTHLVGTIIRSPQYIEGFVYKRIKIDGLDSTDRIIDSIQYKYRDQLECIFTHGLTFAGFNVMNCKKIYENLNVPLIAITKKIPDMKNVKSALEKHFDDWELRYSLFSMPDENVIKINGGQIFIQYYGTSYENAEYLIKNFTISGHIPEPIRISHLIATSFKFGYSKGF